MTEKDYMDVSDLKSATGAAGLLKMGNFLEEPNKTRYLSVMTNLQLMSESLFKEIKIDD